MPKYLIQATYTRDGVTGVLAKGGSSRRDAIAQMLSAVGGQLESLYFGFGERDVWVVADMPDNEAAASVIMTVNASGAVMANTTVLLTPEQVDAAAQRSIDYRPPGS